MEETKDFPSQQEIHRLINKAMAELLRFEVSLGDIQTHKHRAETLKLLAETKDTLRT